MKRETGELLEILKKSSDLSDYMETASDNIVEPALLSDCLKDIMKEKGLEKKQVVRDAGLDRGYSYDIINGSRQPARDKVLALCFGMHLSGDEVQELLKKTGYPLLYPKFERDSIIFFGFAHNLSLCEVNNLLYEKRQLTIE